MNFRSILSASRFSRITDYFRTKFTTLINWIRLFYDNFIFIKKILADFSLFWVKNLFWTNCMVYLLATTDWLLLYVRLEFRFEWPRRSQVVVCPLRNIIVSVFWLFGVSAGWVKQLKGFWILFADFLWYWRFFVID